MRRRGAFTLVEILIVIAILVFGFLSLLTVYTHNVRHATLTRSRLLASLLCESLFAEIREHRYGTPPPASWGDRQTRTAALKTCPVFVQGRAVETSFETLVTVGPGGNGSFFDPNRTDASDVIAATIRWVEGTDDSSARSQKKLYFTLVVRREPNLVVPSF